MKAGRGSSCMCAQIEKAGLQTWEEGRGECHGDPGKGMSGAAAFPGSVPTRLPLLSSQHTPALPFAKILLTTSPTYFFLHP